MLDYKNGGAVLINRRHLGGMTLVEIMVAIAIVALLFAAAAPSFSGWTQNTRVRTATESIHNALFLAKNEALHRNTIAQFVSCGASAWNVIAASGSAIAPASATVCTTELPDGWEIVQTRGSQNETSGAVVDTTQSTIAFNGFGRQASTTDIPNAVTTPTPPVDVSFNITTENATCKCPAGDCGYPISVAHGAGGTLRCLRVLVSRGGMIRMCDPALPPTSPQGCPP